ncbi:hypothetical protein PMAYCL1PPCAC_32012, partial [Pristionchus mayeri]
LAGHVCFVGLSVLLLLSSFVYRLHELNMALEPNHKRRTWWIVFQCAILLLTLLNTITFYLGGTYDLLNYHFGYTFSVVDLTGGLTDNLLPRLSILTLLLICFTGFLSIFLIRRKLFKAIGKLQKSGDRHAHQMIYQSLTAQSLLPLGYMIATAIWLLYAAGFAHSPILHKLTLVLVAIFPLFSPVINMTFVPPYRKSLFCIVNFSNFRPV